MIPGRTYAPDDLLAVVRRRRWLLVAPFAVATVAAVALTARLPNRYRSEALILVVPQRVPETYVRSTVTSRIEDRLQSISQQILSRSRLERIVNEFDLYREERRTGILEDVIEQMRKDIDIQIARGGPRRDEGSSFRVGFRAPNARVAMRVTERLASLFIEENLRDRAVLAEGADQFLESQLSDARTRLVEQERALAAYRKTHSGELPTQLSANLQFLQNAELQVQSLIEAANRDRDRRLVLDRLLADAAAADEATPESATPAEPKTTAGQLAAARELLQRLQQQYTPEHPDVLRTARRIGELERQLAAEAATGPVAAPQPPRSATEIARDNRVHEMEAERERLDREIARKQQDERRLRGTIAEYQRRVEAAPAREAELTALMRDYETLQRVYATLLSKREDAKVAANLERRQIGEQFKILDPASLPERPYSPNRLLLNLCGAMVGLVVGLLLVAWREYMDSTIRNEDEAVASLGVPVLALVPVLRGRSERRRQRRASVVSTAAAIGLVTFSVGLLAWSLLR